MENHDDGATNTSDVLLVESAPKKASAAPDLSAEIALTMERLKGEKVRCRRIFGDNYRCNWLAVDDRSFNRGGTMALESYRVRQSKFLRVRKVGEQLVIEDITAGHN